MFTIFSADCTGDARNCIYPHKQVILDEAGLQEAVSHDYVCAQYRNGYRSGDGFLVSDCLAMDCDNDHSENPADWVTPEDVLRAFPGVTIAVHYSRSHALEKNGKAARPKFHALFPIAPVSDAALYAAMKKRVQSIFPYFDSQALDAARFFFGTSDAKATLYPGSRNLTDFLNQSLPKASVIPEGSRNATLSRFAGRVIKRYGDTEEAYQAFQEEAAKCAPPLEDSELSAIWRSARNFFAKVSRQEGYVSPEEYESGASYKPGDYSDVGQAEMLKQHFSGELRYSPATHFLRYSDDYWQESEPGAQAVAHELTRRQLLEAERDLQAAQEKMKNSGTQSVLAGVPKAKAEQLMTEEQLKIYHEFLDAKAYREFVTKRRDSKYIAATLKEARPMLEISPRDLDADCFLLCTPEATYDLRKGMAGARPHSPEDYITKITSVSPSQEGKQIWMDCLNLIFQNNQSLIDYVQMICGLVAIGKVFVEALIIAYGDGRNGKSTFWNVISRVLGLYSGNISADTLTAGCRRNIKPEMAEAKGKRLLIASESQEGVRLNDSTVKQLCSTDEIYAEKKYKDPFSFTPSHTLVLYTNHLPRVGASDDGIWRRLIVIPFGAKIQGNSDIKNYGDYLYENAGESILAWIIEGAEKVIAQEYRIVAPKCVEEAIADYRAQNDWFAHFLEDKCDVGSEYKESSASLYQAYRNYCMDTNEYVRNTQDFYTALETKGFDRFTQDRKRYFKGLRLRPDEDEEDFLS